MRLIMKILIVDDDQGTLNAIKAGLISFGYKVLMAKDGPQALKIIEATNKTVEPVELMVTDLKMPGMNGMDLIRLAQRETPGLKTILMTAYGDNEVRKEAKTLDICEYIEKPFRPESLLNLIKGFNHKTSINQVA